MSKFEVDSSVDAVLSSAWLYRVIPPAIAILVALALFVLKGEPHDFCLGMALGMLLVLSTFSFDRMWKRNDSAGSDSGLLGSLLRSGEDKAP